MVHTYMKESKYQKMPSSVDDLEQSSWGQSAANRETQQKLLNSIPKLMNRLDASSPVVKQGKSAFSLFKKWFDEGQNWASPRNVIILGGALLYWLSPVDAIPDVLPVVGWLDDIGVLAMAVSFVSSGLLKMSEEEKEQIDKASELVRSQQQSLYAEDSHMADDDATYYDKAGDDSEAKTIPQQDPLRRVIFAGGFSAGKSSLINALLKEKLLPTDATQCTPVLTTVMDGAQASAIWEKIDGSVEIWDDVSSVSDKDKEPKLVKELVITLPSPLLKQGLTLVDTVGLESTAHKYLSYEELPSSSAFVFVKAATIGGLTKEEDDFFRQVSKNVTGNQIVMVINKADLVDSAAVERLNRDLQNYCCSLGLKGVQIFSTSSKEGASETYMLDALRLDLGYRASVSIPAQQEKARRKQQCAAEQWKQVQADLAQKDAEARRAYRTQIQKECERMHNRVQDKAEQLKGRFKCQLQDYADTELLPIIRRKVDAEALNDALAQDIVLLCRNSLSAFVKDKCLEIAQTLQTTCDTSPTVEVGTIRTSAPEVSPEVVNRVADLVLPAIAVLTFFPMGFVTWFTVIAFPTFVMDKLGVGKGVGEILNLIGPCAQARKEFKKSLEQDVAASCEKITIAVAALIDKAVAKHAEAMYEKLQQLQ